ncbi:MAG TPA: hypothetical protein VKS60_00900 [Stellaceae bacterium]|nr:hypothetical protein [Stellaceae bacterium]
MLPPGDRRFLRYWSLNVALARSGGWESIPGFGYDEAERSRIATLAGAVPAGAVACWLAAAVAIYIGLAAAGVIGVVVPAISFLWPNPANMPATGFFALMASGLCLAIGFGLPLSIAWGGAIADRLGAGAEPPEEPGDAPLLGKMRGQFRRIGWILACLFVPIALVCVALGVNAVWIPRVLNLTAAALVLFGAAGRFLRRR